MPYTRKRQATDEMGEKKLKINTEINAISNADRSGCTMAHCSDMICEQNLDVKALATVKPLETVTAACFTHN